MKKRFLVLCVLLPVFMVCMSGCSIFDKDYGNSNPAGPKRTNTENIRIPEIKSDDTVMPTYFDISLYDEENYADIYLGKNYTYKATYSGCSMEVPSTYKDMIKRGFKFLETDEIKSGSKIMAGKSAKVSFEDSYGKQITAVFYNDSSSIKKLTSCSIVKFIINENFLYSPDSVYGQFWVNGITNESAITDVIECLGEPSHFYAVNEGSYYLDYFLTEKDKRSKIRVYIDIPGDCVTGVEFSLY
ncbi:MAG: hypothetical protein J5659_01390 [Clostridia bacterium]|nr:hypothetical protein [Clostridia bacterium]